MRFDGREEANVIYPLPRQVWQGLPPGAQRLLRVWVE